MTPRKAGRRKSGTGVQPRRVSLTMNETWHIRYAMNLASSTWGKCSVLERAMAKFPKGGPCEIVGGRR